MSDVAPPPFFSWKPNFWPLLYPRGTEALTHVWYVALEMHLNPSNPPHHPQRQAPALSEAADSARLRPVECVEACVHSSNSHAHTDKRQTEKGVMGLVQRSFMCVIILLWYCPNPPLIHCASGKMKLWSPLYLSPLHKRLSFQSLDIR